MRKKLILLLSLLLIIVAGFIYLNLNPPASKLQRNTNKINLESRNFLIGSTGFFPDKFPKPSKSDLTEYFDSINKYTNVYAVSTTVDKMNIVDTVAEKVNKDLMLIVGAADEQSWLEDKDIYTDVIRSYLKEYKNIKYLSIGNEINIHFDESSEFDKYASAYASIYKTLKGEYPDVKIFTTFNYETLIGKGAITSNANKSEWELFKRLEPFMDVIGLTVYPYFDYRYASDIPLDYFTQISNYSTKQIIITETAWPSLQTVTKQQVFAASEEEQSSYLKKLAEISQASNVELVNWLGWYDIGANDKTGMFSFAGLKSSGKYKLIWTDWIELAAIPYSSSTTPTGQ